MTTKKVSDVSVTIDDKKSIIKIETTKATIKFKIEDVYTVPEPCRDCPLLLGPCAPNCAHL